MIRSPRFPVAAVVDRGFCEVVGFRKSDDLTTTAVGDHGYRRRVALQFIPAAAMVLVVLSVLGPAARADEAPPEPDGYRMENYRAAVPLTLKGAEVLTSEQAHALWEGKRAVFVDVLPQAPRPKNLPKDVVWRDKPRFDIPGSIWLPDTGYGELATPMLAYFRDGLAKAGERELVFYCQRQCWMSWNAAKRAMAEGFSHVAWYPDGADGWSAAGYPLEERSPEPRPE